MMLTSETWQIIRDSFSQEEKDALNAAISGATICPMGCVLDEEILGPELSEKIRVEKIKLKLKGIQR